MIELEELVYFYGEQYQEECGKRRKSGLKARGYEARITYLRNTMRRMKTTQVTKGLLEDYHRQVKNLVYLAMRARNQKMLRCLTEEIMPELVRLDLALFLPEQKQRMDYDFLMYLEREQPGEICMTPLFDLYQTYKQYYIENKILELVPSRPELEFPEALDMKRRFILHIGPTNSGKTFQALERLKEAGTGVYLGPLRLLALEVYERMKEYGVPCTMLTGQECIAEPGSRITASTVEMADFSKLYDVAVIDEAQMTADPDRGHCWTKAILGIQAPEIHVCMSPIAEAAVIHLIGLCGDEYEIHRYERKTALLCEDTPFAFPDDVQPGDALVVFSKKSVLDVAGRLEERGISASVIYGSLPPEIRRRQMQLFNSGETSVVVATDAIGMGLNLPVRRIVFIQTEKFDGSGRRGLSVQEIKQIAGRAGRFGIYDTGYVNAMGQAALDYVRERLDQEENPVETVSLGFPQILLDLDEPMDEILKVWHSVEPSPPFEKVSIEETLILYEYASRNREYIDGFEDKRILYKMISCPIDVKDKEVVKQWLDYCRNYSADNYLEHPRMKTDERKDTRRWGRFGIRKPEAGGARGDGTQGNETRENGTQENGMRGNGMQENGMRGDRTREPARRVTIQDYETYYKKLDLYYQFSHRFDKIVDEEWLERERSRTEAKIMQYLSGGKENYITRCQYCGRLLPVGSRFRTCARCMEQGEHGSHGRSGGHGGYRRRRH